MTPQNLVDLLLQENEERGRQLLRTHVPRFSELALERLVHFIKKQADKHWTNDAERSFLLSGYILLVGDLARNKYYHALGLMSRGDALRRMDRDLEALPFFDAAGEEFLAIHDEIGWARTRIGRISACLNLSRTTEALRDAMAAHEIFMRHNKLVRAAQVDVNAAVINYELGHYEQALRLFDRAIETYQQHGENVDLNIARARGNKALALAAQGKFREAVALHEQARAAFLAYGEQQEISVAREDLNIADSYASQGHYSEALHLFKRSRQLFQKYHMESAAHEVAQPMCQCLMRLNRVREAHELAEETVEFFRTIPGQRHNLARSLMHLATTATLEGEFTEAEDILQEASDLLEEGGLMRLAWLARLRRAELYFADGHLAASLREAQHVADAFADQEDLPQLARATLLLARIAYAQNDIATASHLCSHALDIAHSQELLDLQYEANDLLGQLAEHMGDLEGAAHYYDRAVQGIDDVQSRLVLDERTSFLENKGGIYQRAMLLSLKLGDKEQALAYIEKAKSRVLGDYLRNNMEIHLRAGDETGELVLDDLSKLRQDHAWFSSIVYDTENEANLSDTAMRRVLAVGPANARKEMQRREQQIERLLEQIQVRSGGDLVARPRVNWTNSIVTSLWQKLEPQALMLEYYVADQDLYIFQLTQHGIDVQLVRGAGPKLERLMSLWQANLDMAGQAAGTQDRATAFFGLQENSLGLLQKLYDLLLQPVIEQVQRSQHLIIVPYGVLHYLPFHCLFDGVQFLIEQHDISYLPSASILEICRQRGQQIDSKALSLQDSLVLGLSDGGRLAFALEEAQAVARQLGVLPALDNAATTSLLLQKGPRSPIVHIAAHGMFRLDAPNFSYIKLANKHLDTIEVFNLDLSSCSLVTLSACETGRAVVRGVDEVIGLGRGFLYAGAASLLPTLWKVDDASSAELMDMFYHSLLNGATKTVALAEAQRAFLARARTSIRPYRVHPYFWAAFHLIGDYGRL